MADLSPSNPSSSDNASGGEGWMDALREIAPYLDLGWRVAVAAAFPPTVGFLVDLWLDTLPWGASIGAALGLLGAVAQLVRLGPEMEKRARKSDES